MLEFHAHPLEPKKMPLRPPPPPPLVPDDPAAFPPYQWVLGPLAASGHVHINLGVLLKAKHRFEWAHLLVLDLQLKPLQRKRLLGPPKHQMA